MLGDPADQPRPSIETLLHAFVPVMHYDQTHPDAIIALTSSPDGRRLAEEEFGDEIVGLDHQLPVFDVAPDRRAARCEALARAAPLEKHGIVTWGETDRRLLLHDRLRHVCRAR